MCFNCEDEFSSTISEENRYTESDNGGGEANPPAVLPNPGNSGFISASLTPSGDVQLMWTRAIDEKVEQSRLLYRAYYSLKSNIATIEGAETLGIPICGWITDATSATASGLEEGTQYFFNILVATPDGRKAAYSMTSLVIPGNIYLYAASGTYQGNLTTPYTASARADVDAYCVPPPGVTPSFITYHAFISISTDDAIIHFPTRYNIPTNWKIVSFSGNTIAYSWTDLLDGSINITLAKANVIDTFWWSGSTDDGSFDTSNNCNGWTSSKNTDNGTSGAHNALEEWISKDARNCNNSLKLLCIGW